MASFPASYQAVKKVVFSTQNIDLTPQESEQLSQYASDDSYVQRQKADIQELTSMFKDLMGGSREEEEEFVKRFEKSFKPQAGLKSDYKIFIGEKRNL